MYQYDQDLIVLNQYAIRDPHERYTKEKALAAMKSALRFAVQVELGCQLDTGINSLFYFYGNLFPEELPQLKADVNELRANFPQAGSIR